MAEGGGTAPAAAAPKNINKSNESSRYFGRLAQELGVAPAVVQTILEHIRIMAIDDLRPKNVFLLRGIATFRYSIISGRSVRTKELHGRRFKSRPYPEMRRVHCKILRQLERAAIDPDMGASADGPVATASQTSQTSTREKTKKNSLQPRRLPWAHSVRR
jgi:hypothetical protein